MKKLFKHADVLVLALAIIFLISLAMTPLPSQAIEPITNVDVNDDATWEPVALKTGQTCEAYAFQSRNGEDFRIKHSLASSEYFTVREGKTYTPEEDHGVPGAVLFYAQAVTGTVTIELWPVK